MSDSPNPPSANNNNPAETLKQGAKKKATARLKGNVSFLRNATTANMNQALETRHVFDAALGSEITKLVSDTSHADPSHESPEKASHIVAAFQADKPLETPASRSFFATHQLGDADTSGRSISNERTELYFIDGSLEDKAILRAAIPASAEIIEIDASKDGVTQMMGAVSGRVHIDAIHILSHGSDGELKLGTSTINEASMSGIYRASFASMGANLSQSADILIYGCDFAAGEKGMSAVKTLAALTGADIAASTDATGAVTKGRDWLLEANAGKVEARALKDEAYNHTLMFVDTLWDNAAVLPPFNQDSPNVAPWANVTPFAQIAWEDSTFFTDIGTPPVPDPFAQIAWEDSTFFADIGMPPMPPVLGASEIVYATEGVSINSFFLPPVSTGETYTFSIGTIGTAYPSGAGLPLNVDTSWLHIDPSTGLVTGTPPSYASGEVQIPYTYTTSSGQVWSSTFTMVIGDDPTLPYVEGPLVFNNYIDMFPDFYDLPPPFYDGAPNLNYGTYLPADIVANSHTPITPIDFGALFVDPQGETITYSAPNLPLGLSIDPVTGILSGTVDASLNAATAQKDYAIKITATDSSGQSTMRDFSVKIAQDSGVNDAPVFAAIRNGFDGTMLMPNSLEGRVGQHFEFNFGAIATDPEGKALTFSATGLPPGLQIDPKTGVVYGEIGATTTQSYPDVTIIATDPEGLATSYKSFISVSTYPMTYEPTTFTDTVGTNDTLTIASNYATPHTGLTRAPLTPIDMSTFVSDPLGHTLTYSATGLPKGVSINATTGIISGTLDKYAVGTYHATVTVRDINANSATVPITITIAENPNPTENLAPVAYETLIAVNERGYTNEPVMINTAPAFSDPNGDALTYSAVGLPNGFGINSTTGLISGMSSVYVETPITITATDPGGLSASTMITLTVTPRTIDPPWGDWSNALPTNEAPVVDATKISNFTHSFVNEWLTIDTAQAFSDPNGDALTFSAIGLPSGVTIDPTTGIISGTPTSAAEATSSIIATDPSGLSAIVSVNLSITNHPTDPPWGDWSNAFTNWDNAFLDNFNDTVFSNNPFINTPFIDSPFVDTTFSDNPFIDTPFVNFTDTTPTPNTGGGFHFEQQAVSNGTATITIDVAQSVSGKVITAEAKNGMITVSADGTLSYKANPGFSGKDYITYVAPDTSGNMVKHHAMVSVTGAPDLPNPTSGNIAPVAIDKGLNGDNRHNLFGSVKDSVLDVNGDHLSFAALSEPQHGQLIFNTDGTFIYQPRGNFSGTDSFSYSVSDGKGGTDTATVSFTIIPASPLPPSVQTSIYFVPFYMRQQMMFASYFVGGNQGSMMISNSNTDGYSYMPAAITQDGVPGMFKLQRI